MLTLSPVLSPSTYLFVFHPFYTTLAFKELREVYTAPPLLFPSQPFCEIGEAKRD